MPLTDDPWLPYDVDGNVAAIRLATPVLVYRYDGVSTLEELPNVLCLHVERHEGTDPGRASFRYNFDSGLEGAPTTIEEALSTESSGAYLVIPGDRLVVRAIAPDASVACLFDGFALDFGLDLDASSEGAGFRAIGVAIRCWDMPISAAYVRDPADVESPTANTQTQRIAWFNPQGRGNAVAYVDDGGSGNDVNDGTDSAHPAFIDHRIVRTPPVSTPWTLEMAVRYILYRTNADEDFVLNPAAADLTALLKAQVPTGSDYDPTDAGTFSLADLIVPDMPVTGKDWPTTVQKLVGDVGFSTMFRLNTASGLPQTVYGIYRAQAGPVKAIYLGPRGSTFDPTTFNFDGASLDRDLSDVANGVVVRGAPIRYEASFILTPAFPSTSTDGSQANLAKYDKGNALFDTTNRDVYRKYVFDETGDGHYAVASTTKVDTIPSLDNLLGSGNYAHLRRPGSGDLVTEDATGRPRKAFLDISTDYAGTKPGLWAGTGTWQRVPDSQWSLLKEQLGIEWTAKNANEIKIGKSTASGAPYPAGIAKGVESQCGMSGAVPFYLRLTCVIEADKTCEHVAERRAESPIPWTIARVVDAADRIKKLIVSKYSALNDTHATFASRIENVVRDDSDDAEAEAVAIQMSLQSGVLGGTVSIPRFTGYYGVGDRISAIEGRNLGLRTDGDPSNSNVVYPIVTGVRWDLDGEQRTTLTLSDAGSDRKLRARRRTLRPDWRRRTNSGG